MTTDRFAEPQLFEVWRMAFRYEDQPEISKERPGECVIFCVRQVLEGGGRNLSPFSLT
jgi:hypothetical protein